MGLVRLVMKIGRLDYSKYDSSDEDSELSFQITCIVQ
jgi:hypothetical protein